MTQTPQPYDKFSLPVPRDGTSTSSASPRDDRTPEESPAFDQFSPPHEIPDASPPPGVPTQDWLSRGLKHPAGRGWDCDDDHNDDDLADPPAQGGARSPWPQGWQPGDPPVELNLGSGGDPFAQFRKFDRPMRARFLDRLACSGEVQRAAALVGVSRETCYRARRRWPDFARLWDAALVHARARAASELAHYALDGVPVPVIVRGEHVATWRRIDARLLLAHVARLDRHAEAHPQAAAAAERFDELLARHLGHAEPEDYAEAAHRSRHWRERGKLAGIPPTRAEYVRHAREEAVEEIGLTRLDFMGTEDPAEALAEAEHAIGEDAAEAAAAEWDADNARALERLDAALDPDSPPLEAEGEASNPPRDGEGDRTQCGGGGSEPRAALETTPRPSPASPPPPPHAVEENSDPNPPPLGEGDRPQAGGGARPIEYKSLELGLAGRKVTLARDRVPHVNTRSQPGAAGASVRRGAGAARPARAAGAGR